MRRVGRWRFRLFLLPGCPFCLAIASLRKRFAPDLDRDCEAFGGMGKVTKLWWDSRTTSVVGSFDHGFGGRSVSCEYYVRIFAGSARCATLSRMTLHDLCKTRFSVAGVS